MKNKYMTLKLNETEIKTLEIALSKIIVEDMSEKTKPNYEDKLKEDYWKYDKLHKEAVNCKKILNIIKYLKR